MTTGVRKPGEFCWINMLTPQPAEARAFFAGALRLDLRRDAGHGSPDAVGRPRHRRPLRPRESADAARHAAAHRRDGEGRQRRCDGREGEGARRQGAGPVRRDDVRAHGRVLRSQRCAVRRLGAEDRRRHRCGYRASRHAELVRIDDHRCRARQRVLHGALRLDRRGDDVPRFRLHDVQAGRRLRRRHDGDHAADGRDAPALGHLLHRRRRRRHRPPRGRARRDDLRARAGRSRASVASSASRRRRA